MGKTPPSGLSNILIISKQTSAPWENPNKNTFLFCAGGYGRSTLERFNKIGIKINGIVDNNIAFKNKKIGNYRVKHSSYLKKNLKKFKNFNILICNNNIFDFKKIKTQLFKMGYLKTNIRNFNLL